MEADRSRPEGTERWEGIARPYQPSDVRRLRGSVPIAYTLATRGAQRLWQLVRTRPYVPTLGVFTGGQAVQVAQAGLPAIYASGWQVAADANGAGQTYPDQSLYPSDSMPALVRRLNAAFRREDEKQSLGDGSPVDWYVPILADAEAGFGGVLNAFELTKALIESGAAGLHLEDQLSSAKKCGHLGGKVLVPTREFLQKLWAARLAADVLDVPTIIMARTDALSARLLTSDIDPLDQPFLGRERTSEGFFSFRGGLEAAIARGRAAAPYADLVWFETAAPDLEEARAFADAVRSAHPGKMLAYNCSPSFHWSRQLDPGQIGRFQADLGELGYRFQFITLAGFHSMNVAMFHLATEYVRRGMSAYAELQDTEFAQEPLGYRATRHQSFVGTEYFDEVARVLSGGDSSTLAMDGSTERGEFGPVPSAVAPPVSRPRSRGSAAEVKAGPSVAATGRASGPWTGARPRRERRPRR